jgi:16S rRNA processing protein RimM
MKDLIVVATIKAPHGLQGECKIFTHSGEIEHLKTIRNAQLFFKGHQKGVEVEYFRGSVKNPILKIKNLDTPEKVKELSGAELMVPRSEAAKLEEGQFYIADIVGCTIYFEDREIGRVKSVWESAASDVLEVELHQGGIAHIPIQEPYIEDFNPNTGRIDLCVDWIIG